MKINMSSDATVIAMALIHGASKALGKLAIGASSSHHHCDFRRRDCNRSLDHVGVVWVALRIFNKQQHTYAVTSWILLVGALLSIALAVVEVGEMEASILVLNECWRATVIYGADRIADHYDKVWDRPATHCKFEKGPIDEIGVYIANKKISAYC